MQCACAMLSSVACPAVKGFSILYHKDEIFEKKELLKLKYVLIFSTTFSESFLTLRRTERDMIKTVHWFSCKVSFFFFCVFFSILMELEFSQQSLDKYSNINFHKNKSSVTRVVSCGRT